MELKGLSSYNPLFSALKDAARVLSAPADKGGQAATGEWAAFNEEQARLRQTSIMLQSARSSASEDSKEAARQKIERIKAQIQALRMMGGDPKTVARQAARLVQELASAARDYAGGAAVGTPIAGTAAAATASVTAATATAGAAVAANTTAAEAAGPSVSPPATDSSVPKAAVPAEDAGDVAGRAVNSAAATEEEDAAPSVKDAAEKPPVATGHSEDENFVREVRRLLAELKNIIRGAQKRMDGDEDRGVDIRTADKALHEAEQAIGQMEAGAAAGVVTAGLNITV